MQKWLGKPFVQFLVPIMVHCENVYNIVQYAISPGLGPCPDPGQVLTE